MPLRDWRRNLTGAKRWPNVLHLQRAALWFAEHVMDRRKNRPHTSMCQRVIDRLSVALRLDETVETKAAALLRHRRQPRTWYRT